MPRLPLSALLALTLLAALPVAAAEVPTRDAVLAASTDAEWREVAPEQLLVMQLDGAAEILIELAPEFAPRHVDNIRTLVRERYFDATRVYRVQDNFVAQWGDPHADEPGRAKSMGSAATRLPPEYTRASESIAEFTRLPDGDLHALEVGFSGSMPAARNRMAGQAWLVHCYGMVGVARDTDPESGSGNTLYAIIGTPPRRLDHQLAVVGRVLAGMPVLAALPRGPEPMGMHADPADGALIRSVRLAAELPPDERPRIAVLRTTSASFARLLEAARQRQDDFYRQPVGRVDLCGAELPVRRIPATDTDGA